MLRAEEKPAANTTENKSAAAAEIVNTKSGSFAVIAGAFAIEENADHYVAEMQQKGFKAIRFGKHKTYSAAPVLLVGLVVAYGLVEGSPGRRVL